MSTQTAINTVATAVASVKLEKDAAAILSAEAKAEATWATMSLDLVSEVKRQGLEENKKSALALINVSLNEVVKTAVLNEDGTPKLGKDGKPEVKETTQRKPKFVRFDATKASKVACMAFPDVAPAAKALVETLLQKSVDNAATRAAGGTVKTSETAGINAVILPLARGTMTADEAIAKIEGRKATATVPDGKTTKEEYLKRIGVAIDNAMKHEATQQEIETYVVDHFASIKAKVEAEAEANKAKVEAAKAEAAKAAK